MAVITWPSKIGPCVMEVTTGQLLEHARQCPTSDLTDEVLRMPPPEWVRRIYVYQGPSKSFLWIRIMTVLLVAAMLLLALWSGFLLRHYMPDELLPVAPDAPVVQRLVL